MLDKTTSIPVLVLGEPDPEPLTAPSAHSTTDAVRRNRYPVENNQKPCSSSDERVYFEMREHFEKSQTTFAKTIANPLKTTRHDPQNENFLITTPPGRLEREKLQ